MRRINILHVIDKLSMDGVNPSSCTVLFGDWVSSLDPDRFHTNVCTLRNPDPAGSYLEEREIAVDYLNYGKISPGNVKGITSLIERENIDIVHLHGYSSANFGRIAAKKKGIPNIVHEHAVLKVLPHQFIVDKLLSRLTDKAIAVSEYVKEFMVNYRSIPSEKILVIGNGIRLEKYSGYDESFQLKKRAELGIQPGTQVVGTVTRLRQEKGNEYLIRAVPLILKQREDVVFLVVGDGPLREKLERIAAELRVQHAVRFLGFRSDVPELLSIFDVQVIPSLTEGFPLCLAEAMAAGNATVATEVGGMKEIGREGETLLFVPPGDHEALGKKITYLLEQRECANEIAQRARLESREFGIENCSAHLGQLYEELAGQSGKT